uniref:Uncharacterized protein n=1 Tax=Oryza nivara TaxID=4536 RepID=A0A0E0IXL5_ORYNI
MAITEEDVPAAKKMKTRTEDDHEEVLLAYPPRKKEDGKKMKKVKMKTTTEDDHEEVLLAYRPREKEDGKKRKKVVRRLGKEEVERLLSLKLAVPTLSEEVVMPMPDDDEDDVWQKEVLLRANRLLRESAIRMRKNKELIRSLFEAKGYVDVEDEFSDDDDMDMEMQPV